MAQLDAIAEPERSGFRLQVRQFLDRLVSHLWLDGGNLVVAHAGLIEAMQGRGSGAVRAFALYGETTGEIDTYGLPVRLDWAAQYRGAATVVYGHTPTPVAEWVNKTICIDTGCVFGGHLTALRYPERALVSVPAAKVYQEPVRPLGLGVGDTHAQQTADAMLDLDDIEGKRTIATRLMGAIRVEPDQAAAALEIMSRFAVDPRWLIYLPPTMSPPETTARPGLLEHPDEAFAYYARTGLERVVIEEKHMGSRAILVIAKDAETARRRFGVEDDKSGVVYTRTGRAFFADPTLEAAMVARIAAAADRIDLWSRLDSDWFCLDAELLPWSAKAQSLIDGLYRPVGDAGIAGTEAAMGTIQQAISRGIAMGDLAARLSTRHADARAYDAAWRRYVHPVGGLSDLRLAPFHLLASAKAVHRDQPHTWHMAHLAELAACDQTLLIATPYRVVDLADPSAVAEAIAWWEERTGAGGEGMVVKPEIFVTRGKKTIVQPAIKCRGREYLRIIYGPDYTMPEHLDRLRTRSVAAKRQKALAEFALGMEALDRFVAGAPLRKVHECVFAILALESDPIDPRL